jgi:glutamate-1-semialdehyde aminotransferase
LKIESIEANKRASQSIAHGALTNSKRPSTFVKGVYPTHIKSGSKCYLTDVDGNKYIDYICGLGTNLFGYSNNEIRQSVRSALEEGGVVYSLSSIDEVNYAETLKSAFPFLERVRFLKDGSSGCTAAIKMARAFTGRKYVMSEGYHGWHDDFVQLTKPAKGVIKDTFTVNLNDNVNERFLENVAAVIVEPVILDASTKRQVWLQKLREKCTKSGTVLIYDETITAFRFPQYCVARHFNVLPDLWIAGKALAGGFPISVIGGRQDVMESDYFVSSTWAGDRVAIAAGMAANRLIHTDFFNPESLWLYGSEFCEKFNQLSKYVKIEGYPTRGRFDYSVRFFQSLFMQEMALAGVLIGPSWFYNIFLHQEMENVLDIAKTIIKKIQNGNVKLKGIPPVSPFAERVRNADKN